MKLVFLGPPGSGKGTQSQKLCSERGFTAIATGNLLRDEVKAQSDLGKEVADCMERGDLVSDSIVFELVKNKVQECDNYILDGFPRNIDQAKSLDIMLDDIGHKIDKVINFTLPDEVLIRRITGRFTCSSCSAVYNDFYKKTLKPGICDKCGSTEFDRRQDDNEETLKRRLEVFHKTNDLICQYYEKNNLLISLEALKDEGFIFDLLQKVINEEV